MQITIQIQLCSYFVSTDIDTDNFMKFFVIYRYRIRYFWNLSTFTIFGTFEIYNHDHDIRYSNSLPFKGLVYTLLLRSK